MVKTSKKKGRIKYGGTESESLDLSSFWICISEIYHAHILEYREFEMKRFRLQVRYPYPFITHTHTRSLHDKLILFFDQVDEVRKQ
jgi:hypothetical protein